ncbi:hypothetical protein V8F20_008866 [Naviculisporaceae sp. PSN 640]
MAARNTGKKSNSRRPESLYFIEIGLVTWRWWRLAGSLGTTYLVKSNAARCAYDLLVCAEGWAGREGLNGADPNVSVGHSWSIPLQITAAIAGQDTHWRRAQLVSLGLAARWEIFTSQRTLAPRGRRQPAFPKQPLSADADPMSAVRLTNWRAPRTHGGPHFPSQRLHPLQEELGEAQAGLGVAVGTTVEPAGVQHNHVRLLRRCNKRHSSQRHGQPDRRAHAVWATEGADAARCKIREEMGLTNPTIRPRESRVVMPLPDHEAGQKRHRHDR